MSPTPWLCVLLAFTLANCRSLEPDPVGGAYETLSWQAQTGRVKAARSGVRGQPRLIFVHGTPGDAGAFRSFLADPFPGWESISVDRPGFGSSAPLGAVTSLEQQAGALAPLFEDEASPRAVLVGHSLGAGVVLRAAADFPGRIAGIVLLAGAVDPSLEKLRWYNYLAFPFEWLLPRALGNSNREIRAYRRELTQLAEDLKHVECPILMMHGTEDSLVPYANVDFVRRLFPGAEIITLEGGNHFFIWSEVDRFRDALWSFLEGLDVR